MSFKILCPSYTFTKDGLKELTDFVPKAFVDGKISRNTLYEALGEYFEDENQEYFSLTWQSGKSNA